MITKPSFTLDVPHLHSDAVELKMRWVEPGEFVMGAGYWHKFGDMGDDYPDDPFVSRLTRGYWMGQYPITQAQWVAIMSSNPSHFINSDAPVEMVTWIDAMEFISRLNKFHTTTLPEGYSFSLPTEAQWEFACSVRTRTRFYSGQTEADLDKVAWYVGNSGRTTHPVGQKYPNEWGFFDFHGNVCEWCSDWASPYPPGAAIEWAGASSGDYKIQKGGNWGTTYSDDSIATCGRVWLPPDFKTTFIGFRLCLSHQST